MDFGFNREAPLGPITDLDGFLLDEYGMILPHSILGTLEDFRCYLISRGETELVKLISDPSSSTFSDMSESYSLEKKGLPLDKDSVQTNALQKWEMEMKIRKRQQEILSSRLSRPVDILLMTQMAHYRQAVGLKDKPLQGQPDFWSLPLRLGDETTGISYTLTRREKGQIGPITHVGLPHNSLREMSLPYVESPLRLHHSCRKPVMTRTDKDFICEDFSDLQVMGSGKQITVTKVCRSPSLEKLEEMREEKEKSMENFDVLADYDDVPYQTPPIPALRFCGQLATWTGNASPEQMHQREVGISATLLFEAESGERASSFFELQNEGSTVINYNWRQLTIPQNFPRQQPQAKRTHFYFNSFPGVICPGETQRVEFVFKSEEPGLQTEIWQLNTNPVLLQGAPLRVILRGVCLRQDDMADLKLYLRTKLEKIEAKSICELIMDKVLQAVQSPERPSSPDVVLTEEKQFEKKNPCFHLDVASLERLKEMWRDARDGDTWDLSLATLQKALLAFPVDESCESPDPIGERLTQLNQVLMHVPDTPGLRPLHLTAIIVGNQLWRNLLDSMAEEDQRIRDLLGLPEIQTWTDDDDDLRTPDSESSSITEGEQKPEKSTRREETPTGRRSMLRSREEGRGKGDKSAHDDKHRKTPLHDRSNSAKIAHSYSRMLHSKVLAMMEELVDNLCDVIDELQRPEPIDPEKALTIPPPELGEIQILPN